MELITFSASLMPRLAGLFDVEPPVPIRLWAMLDGIIESRILVDDPRAPACCLIQELAEGTVYLGGAVSAPDLAAGINRLRGVQEVVICHWPGALLDGVLPPAPDYDGEAIDFTDRSPTVDLNAFADLPPGYELRPIDQAIVPLLAGFEYYASMFGSVERAIEQTIGYCIVHGREVVSEAVAGPLARGIAEIGVGTHAAHRRRGLATAAAARVIQACEGRGYQPFWNASQRNVPSVALARRLGFRTARPFRVLAWSGPA